MKYMTFDGAPEWMKTPEDCGTDDTISDAMASTDRSLTFYRKTENE